MSEQRTVPITKLRARYNSLKGMVTAARVKECQQLAADPVPLVEEFEAAVRDVQTYSNEGEPFHEVNDRKELGPRGADEVLVKWGDGLVQVPGLQLSDYLFRVVARELAPLRTTGSFYTDETAATKSGAGGIDYVGMTMGPSPIPILGETKTGDDKDTFYAFVQLLTYASELASDSQMRRANKFLFDGRLNGAPPLDLHILHVDFNTRSKPRVELLESTKTLAEGVFGRLTEASRLGRVLCLTTESADLRNIHLNWCVERSAVRGE